ncbi:carboxyltransferase domain-containing protein [Allofrancisella guangzhouensis]|uniref:Allophanate hydrolase n=1 Tax=Allofrancisella guangzhouensis TaxID=594679 RepID=A0A0A8E285_9GAMM|nr:carboxyltransferase domain-containing protein [Allofrancisella guangzhouensis]AJC48330.1 allophanate hydrolase [Allofrancisella guangzhouensis]MBK2026581.1 carboxyltransferase domain-containing protein [Allofrancisella guangzhouensis]MBK2044325.1 carboxyltransferase domain-containing protein [Allofrancisella guangzhouensis]MBK2045568.1 carboxyltransferase domain-containing protein [Allofrancisella guangzhouensis]
MNYYFLSESCFIYNLSNRLSIDDNLKILKIYKFILDDKSFCNDLKIYDIVPAYNSIAFHFFYNNNHLFLQNSILKKIELVDYSKHIESKTHYIDVEYTGIDLETASQKLGLNIPEIIKRHTASEYHIAMLGFKPYLPYLLGLDISLSLPRLATPRNKIDVGSIGIGGSQTTIFTTDTPSGWNIIGKTAFRDFPSFSPADKIIFREI